MPKSQAHAGWTLIRSRYDDGALGGSNLVPDTLGRDLPLELGKGQEHVEGEPTHRRRRVELLGDRDEGDIMGSTL